METKQHTPSVIAKLMGLDELPSQQPIRKQQRVLSENYLWKTASICLREKRSFYKARSFRMNIEKQQEFKDVFAVPEKDKHPIQSVSTGKGNSSTAEAKVAFIRQNFTDSNSHSVKKKLRHSNEFNAMLDDLDSNKDILWRYLQKRDSLFTKNLHDLQGLQPNSQSDNIAVMKSSNVPNYRSNEKLRKSEKTTARRNILRSLQKLEHGFIADSFGDVDIDNFHNMLKSPLGLKNETRLPPTRIVVLKPNLGKAKNSAISLPQSGDSKQEFLRPIHGGLYNEVRNSENPVNYLEPSKYGFGLSSGPAKEWEITRQIMHNVSSSSTEESRSEVRVDGTSVNEPEVLMPYRERFFDRKNQIQTSYSSSNVSSFTMKAKKRLSEQWKMTKISQDVGAASRDCTLGEILAMPDQDTMPINLNYKLDKHGPCSEFSLNGENSELGSPLDIHNKDGWKDDFVTNLPISGSLPASCNADGSPKSRTRNEAFHNGRSLRLEEAVTEEGYKLMNQKFLEKDRSKPRDSRFSCEKFQDSSYMDLGNNHTLQETKQIMDELGNKLEENYVVSKLSSCNGPYSDSDYNHPAQGIQVIQDEPENSFESNMSKNSENNSMVLDSSSRSLASLSMSVDVVADAKTEDVRFSCGDPHGQQSEPATCKLFAKDGHSCSCAWDASIGQESSIGSPEDGLVSPNCTRIEPEFLMSLGEAYQASPSSVLEPPFKDEILSGSDLHGLWMQLQLLKSEAEDTHSGRLGMVVSSEEDTREGSIDYSEENGKFMRLFRTEESRDSSYLVDVLDEAGFYSGNSEISFEILYSREWPVSPSVFESLEKKYGDQMAWKKSERRLLFDRINSGLIEILHPCMDIRTWPKPLRKRINGATLRGDLIEEDLWMLLVSQENEVRKNLSEKAIGKEMWLELGEDIDIIAREIENFLFNELAAELARIESF